MSLGTLADRHPRRRGRPADARAPGVGSHPDRERARSTASDGAGRAGARVDRRRARARSTGGATAGSIGCSTAPPSQLDAGVRSLARPLPLGARDGRRADRAIITDASTLAGAQAGGEAAAPRGRGAARAADRGRAARATQSDFYSYRYMASEGFLPGYNFPRLPLSAYIPGRRTRAGRSATSSSSAPASWRSPSSGRAASSTTRARATWSTR